MRRLISLIFYDHFSNSFSDYIFMRNIDQEIQDTEEEIMGS